MGETLGFLCSGAIKRKRHSLTSEQCPLSHPASPYKSINLNCQAAVKLCCYRERFSFRFWLARLGRGFVLLCFGFSSCGGSRQRDFGYGDMSRFTTEWL